MPRSDRGRDGNTPAEVGREALQEFERYLAAGSEEQQRSILDLLHRDRPEVADSLERLLQGHVAAGQTLNSSALDRLNRLPDIGEPPVIDSKPADWQQYSGRPGVARSLLAIAIFIVLSYAWVGSLLLRFGNETVEAGWDAKWNGKQLVVTTVDPRGSAAGRLMAGDRISAINGDAGKVFLARYWLSVDNELRYRLRVSRHGQTFGLTLRALLQDVPYQVADRALFFIVGGFFLLTALAIIFFKPNDGIARLAAMSLTAEALVLVSVTSEPYLDLMAPSERWLARFLLLPCGIHFALAYHFYWAFFNDLLYLRPRRYVIWALYVGGAIASLAIEFASGAFQWQSVLRLTGLLQNILLAKVVFYVVTPVLICGLIALRYRKIRNRPGYLRAKWIVFGSLFGILPYTLYGLISIALRRLDLLPNWDLMQRIFQACIVAALAIPVCTAYAVLRYQAFDIQVLIRKSIQYSLLSSVLWTLMALPLAGMLISLVQNRERTVGEALGRNAGFLLLFLLFSVLLVLRTRGQRWLDEHYGRDAAKRALTLHNFGAEIRKCNSEEELAAAAGVHVRAILPTRILLIGFENEQDGSFQVKGREPQCVEAIQMGAHSAVLSFIERAGRPVLLEEVRAAAPGNSETRYLQAIGIDLAVPLIASKKALVGALFLASSREGYTAAQLNDLWEAADDLAGAIERVTLERRFQEQTVISDEARARLTSLRKETLLECPTCGLCFDCSETRCSADGSDLILTYSVGRVIGNRYQLFRRLDAGGMATVYLGHDLKMKRRVAVKIIAPSPGMLASAWGERATQEARALAQLSHPNIVTAYDYGTVESGAAYLVMEYVQGNTLRKTLSAGRVGGALAAKWFDQILDGLGAAHQAGIIHRDLKPENIMIAEREDSSKAIKILDFGIAKIVGEDEAARRLTMAGSRLGTPIYMSPEQYDGQPVDERTDIFSIGVMILEVLTGELPFTGSSVRHRFVAWLHGDGALPVSTEVDLLLNQALRRCLAPIPEHRFRSVKELRMEIIPLITSYRGPLKDENGEELAARTAG